LRPDGDSLARLDAIGNEGGGGAAALGQQLAEVTRDPSSFSIAILSGCALASAMRTPGIVFGSDK